MTFFRPSRGLLALACGAFSLVAAAAPVSYSFTGNVTYDEADRGHQAFAGSFSFDSAAVNAINDPSGSTGSYTGAGAAWTMSLSFDGGTSLDFGSQGLHVNVTNDLGGYDWLGLLGTGSAGTVSAGLYDFTMALFVDAGLPLRDGGYTLADFGWSEFRWESAAGTLQGVLASLNCTAGCSAAGGGPVTLPSAVPEPGSLGLAAVGLGVMLRLRRRA